MPCMRDPSVGMAGDRANEFEYRRRICVTFAATPS